MQRPKVQQKKKKRAQDRKSMKKDVRWPLHIRKDGQMQNKETISCKSDLQKSRV